MQTHNNHARRIKAGVNEVDVVTGIVVESKGWDRNIEYEVLPRG